MKISPPPKTGIPELDAWLDQLYKQLTYVPQLRFTAPTASTSSDKGELAITSGYLYVAYDNNTWKKITLDTI